jgi:hypothetical protein
MSAAGFGGVALVGALFFLNAVPRVRRDVLERLPVVGNYWIGKGELPPSDNVGFTSKTSQIHSDLLVAILNYWSSRLLGQHPSVSCDTQP